MPIHHPISEATVYGITFPKNKMGQISFRVPIRMISSEATGSPYTWDACWINTSVRLIGHAIYTRGFGIQFPSAKLTDTKHGRRLSNLYRS